MAMKAAGRLLLCGTHAYKPMCREYVYKDSEYVVEKQVNGQGVSPYDPTHNSTAVLVGKFDFLILYLFIYLFFD